MGVADSVKNSIYNVIDTVFGSTFIVSTISRTYNDYGDETETVDSTKSINAVYSNNNPFGKSLEIVGEVSEGNMRLYVKSDDNVQDGDVITFDGTDYEAKSRGLLGFQNVKIVDVFELTRKL